MNTYENRKCNHLSEFPKWTTQVISCNWLKLRVHVRVPVVVTHVLCNRAQAPWWGKKVANKPVNFAKNRRAVKVGLFCAFSAGYWAFAGLRHKCQTPDFIRNKPNSIFRGASQGAKGFLSRLTRYYYISRYKNVIPKYLENAPIDFAQISRTLRYILEEQARVSHFKKKSQCREIPSASEIDNDVISLLSTAWYQHNIGSYQIFIFIW